MQKRYITKKNGVVAGLVVLALVASTVPTQADGLHRTGIQVDTALEDAGEPQRLSIPLQDYLEQFQEPNHGGVAPMPTDIDGIRPGQRILVNIPNDPINGGGGTFICTLSFLFKNETTGKIYAGTAGHCVLPGWATATNGTGADYDASGVTISVCNTTCLFGGQLSGFLWGALPLGEVAYARQTNSTSSIFCPAGDIGNDFALIEIYEDWYDTFSFVNPAMAVWHGPTGEDSNEGTGSTLVHYGNGVTWGTTFLTSPRVGTSLNDGVFCSFQAITNVAGGDSGSAVSHAAVGVGHGPGLHGDLALGTLTHAIIGAGTPAWGTNVFRGLQMAEMDTGGDLIVDLMTA